MSPTRARERPLHAQMAVSQRPDGEETGKGKRSLSVQGTGGAGRLCHQPCSRQSRGERAGLCGPTRLRPMRWLPSHAAALPRGCSRHTKPAQGLLAVCCCPTRPVRSWRLWWSLLGVGAGSGEAAPPSVLSPAFSRGLAVFCEGSGTQCLQLLSSAGLCRSCTAVLGSHIGGPGQRSE